MTKACHNVAKTLCLSGMHVCVTRVQALYVLVCRDLGKSKKSNTMCGAGCLANEAL